MIQGFNKANDYEYRTWESRSRQNFNLKKRACVFLSHKHEDKPACRKIADYLRKAGIDYYLDEEDTALQESVLARDPYRITENIKKGINKSTHMLCLVSKKTYNSHWVPFEVGYGHAAIIDKAMEEDRRAEKIKLSILITKDLSAKNLPDFMKVGLIIPGTKSLNDYVSQLLNKRETQLINEGGIISNRERNHPLSNILNFEL